MRKIFFLFFFFHFSVGLSQKDSFNSKFFLSCGFKNYSILQGFSGFINLNHEISAKNEIGFGTDFFYTSSKFINKNQPHDLKYKYISLTLTYNRIFNKRLFINNTIALPIVKYFDSDYVFIGNNSEHFKTFWPSMKEIYKDETKLRPSFWLQFSSSLNILIWKKVFCTIGYSCYFGKDTFFSYITQGFHMVL